MPLTTVLQRSEFPLRAPQRPGISKCASQIPQPTPGRRPFSLSEQELATIPQVCSSLEQALDALDADRDFLKRGDVFTDSFIDAYIDLRRHEYQNFEETPPSNLQCNIASDNETPGRCDICRVRKTTQAAGPLLWIPLH